MAIHAIVRTDLMHGSNQPADLVSLKYQVSNIDSAIDNGNVVVLNGLIAGQREVYAAKAPAANSPFDSVVLVATPELIYDETPRKTYADFENEAGAVARGYRIRKGDVFSATIEAFTGHTNISTVTVGDTVELQAGTKMKIVTAATASSTVIGKVIAKEGNYVVVAVQ